MGKTYQAAMKAVLAMAFAGALGVPAHADEAEPFPGYAQLCGYPIERRVTPRLSQALTDAQGQSVIVLDPRLYAQHQAMHRVFLIAHECAHHRMEHTSRQGLAQRMTQRHGVRDQELSADCWAAETMTALGMDAAVRRLADEFWRRGFVNPGQGYPSGIQRSNMLRHCAAIARARLENTADGGSDFAAMRDHHP